MARVFKKRGEYWIDFHDAQGNRHRKKVGGSHRVANEILTRTIDAVNREEFLGVVDSSPISFADFAKEWFATLRPDMSPRTKERFADALRLHLKPHFKCALRAITAAGVEAYVSKRIAEGAAASTVNGETCVLKLVLRRATSQKVLGNNPLRDRQGQLLDCARPLKEPPGRVRYLAPDEIARLLVACEQTAYLYAFTLIALNTGMRRNEVLSLTHQTIDRSNRLVRLTETKNGTARAVHLNDTAFAAIESLPRRLDGRLFPFTPNQVSMAFERAVRRAQIEDFRLHDLRHTFASYQAMAGTTGKALQELVGHRDGRMTARYTHLSADFLRAAVNAVQLGGATAATAAPKADAKA